MIIFLLLQELECFLPLIPNHKKTTLCQNSKDTSVVVTLLFQHDRILFACFSVSFSITFFWLAAAPADRLTSLVPDDVCCIWVQIPCQFWANTFDTVLTLNDYCATLIGWLNNHVFLFENLCTLVTYSLINNICWTIAWTYSLVSTNEDLLTNLNREESAMCNIFLSLPFKLFLLLPFSSIFLYTPLLPPSLFLNMG